MKILFVIMRLFSEIQQEKFTSNDVLITGVGMLNTAIVLTKKLSKEKYDLVINLGIGSFKRSIKIGDVVEVIRRKNFGNWI